MLMVYLWFCCPSLSYLCILLFSTDIPPSVSVKRESSSSTFSKCIPVFDPSWLSWLNTIGNFYTESPSLCCSLTVSFMLYNRRNSVCAFFNDCSWTLLLLTAVGLIITLDLRTPLLLWWIILMGDTFSSDTIEGSSSASSSSSSNSSSSSSLS